MPARMPHMWMQMWAGVQKLSRPMERCQEISHWTPAMAQVTAATEHQMYQGMLCVGKVRDVAAMHGSPLYWRLYRACEGRGGFACGGAAICGSNPMLGSLISFPAFSEIPSPTRCCSDANATAKPENV